MVTLDRAGLTRLGVETLNDLIKHPPAAPDAHRFVIRMTSGTTGGEPVVIANEYKEGDTRRFEGTRRLMISMGGRNTRLANILVLGAQNDIRALAVDEKDVDDDHARLLQDFSPDAIRGFTSFVARVGNYLQGAAPRVKLLKLSGEKWTSSLRERFAERFPNARAEILYIANEIGPIADRLCPALKTGWYHPSDGVQIEIRDPSKEGVGDVLITKKVFRNMGVRRYKIGDVGRMAGRCWCGEQTFELLGRKGSDYIKVAGALLLRDEFDRVAALCRNLFEDYRAEVRAEPSPTITLRVYAPRWKWRLKKNIAQRFSAELFVTPTRTLAELIETGIFQPLEVVRITRPFPRGTKEVKLLSRI